MARAKRAAEAEPPYRFVDDVAIGRIFLAPHNPRHEPVESESEAIERLCSAEDVLPLARDIVRHGVSPLERFALTEIPRSGRNPSYYVEEGNRRICALKLLADSELAPARMRQSFEKLGEAWTPITNIDAAVFADLDQLRIWLDRTHSGPQGGVGRKVWNAEQKQRFFGGTKNRLGQLVLDYAEAEGMITKQERVGKITTAQRFLNPDVFQEALGIDRSNPDELMRTRPKAEFDAMLRRFMRDLVGGEVVNSRKNKPEVIQYARELTAMPGITNNRIDPEPLGTDGPSPARRRGPRRTPRRPERAKKIRFDDDIFQALRGLANYKLESLYHSICTIELELNTPIVSIGTWAFFETLTSCQGRNDSTSFDSYLTKAKLAALGFQDSKALREALSHISALGNTTKHHSVAAHFNGDQLNNDMITLKDVIVACIAEATPSA